MTIFTGFIIYFLIWWVVIFCALPFGIRDEESKGGNMPGAPANHGLKKKVIITTLISCVVWVIVYCIITYGGISFHDEALKMKL